MKSQIRPTECMLQFEMTIRKPVIDGDTIAMQKGIRDSHIFRGSDGGFYLAMTKEEAEELARHWGLSF